MSRALVGSPEEAKMVLNKLHRHSNYYNNRIISTVQGDLSVEVLEDLALKELWEAAKADKGYQKAAKLVADKVPVATMQTINGHKLPLYRLLVLKKAGTRLLLLDSTRLVIRAAFRQTILRREYVTHQVVNKTPMSVAGKYIWPG